MQKGEFTVEGGDVSGGSQGQGCSQPRERTGAAQDPLLVYLPYFSLLSPAPAFLTLPSAESHPASPLSTEKHMPTASELHFSHSWTQSVARAIFAPDMSTEATVKVVAISAAIMEALGWTTLLISGPGARSSPFTLPHSEA